MSQNPNRITQTPIPIPPGMRQGQTCLQLISTPLRMDGHARKKAGKRQHLLVICKNSCKTSLLYCIMEHAIHCCIMSKGTQNVRTSLPLLYVYNTGVCVVNRTTSCSWQVHMHVIYYFGYHHPLTHNSLVLNPLSVRCFWQLSWSKKSKNST